MQGDASLPPSIILQRQATSLSELGDPAGRKVEVIPLESLSGGISDILPTSVSSGNISPPPLPFNLIQGSVASKPHETSETMEVQPGPAPVKDESYRASSLRHRLTEPMSMTSTNSRIRMVDTRRKRRRIVSFDDVNDIPGAEILVFDQEQRKWRAYQKARVPCEQLLALFNFFP